MISVPLWNDFLGMYILVAEAALLGRAALVLHFHDNFHGAMVAAAHAICCLCWVRCQHTTIVHIATYLAGGGCWCLRPPTDDAPTSSAIGNVQRAVRAVNHIHHSVNCVLEELVQAAPLSAVHPKALVIVFALGTFKAHPCAV